jgi:hypothetical protein
MRSTRLSPEGRVDGGLTAWTARFGVGVILVGALLMCVLVGAWGAGSARADSFSAPYRILPAAPAGSAAAQAVSCPSATQCTAVSNYGFNSGQAYPGYEVTFDPATQTVNAAGVKTIDTNSNDSNLNAVSCPSVTQCTAVDGNGDEVTFDPTTGRDNAAGVANLSSLESLQSVSCPSTTQCTAIGTDEITFDPTTGKVNAAGPQPFGNFEAGPLSCPSVTQCTTVTGRLGNANTELTFDPMTGANPADRKKVGYTAYFPGVSCPSAMQCTAATTLEGYASGVVTFDPMTGTANAAGTTDIPPHNDQSYFEPAGVSCPSVSQCTDVGVGTSQVKVGVHPFVSSVTFNPASPAGASPAYGQSTAADNSPTAVDCATASQCVAVLSSGLAVNITPVVSGGGPAGNGTGVSVHGSPSGNGGVVKVALACAASSNGCRVTATLTTTPTRRRTVSVGSRTVRIAAGKTSTVTVTLNATGRRLLARRHRLPVRLRVAVSGRTVTTRSLTVKPARKR